MLKAENWVGEYTSTVGDGTLTLGGQIDGFCGFAVVGDNVQVYYTIMDGSNKETGIGTVVGNSLTRDTIHAVLQEGTYIKGGSPLSLSGDAQVYLTANAHFLGYVQGIDQAAAELKAKVDAMALWSINGHPITANMQIDAEFVGARPATWTPTAEEVGSYSKSASDQRYVASDAVETGEQPGKIMIVGGPRDKQLVQKIEQADQQLQQNIDNIAVTFIGPNPPQNAPEGKKWFDTNSGRSYIYFNDGDSLQWVEESPQGNGLIDTSPLLMAMASQNFGPIGFRNILINGDFRVNQRSYDGNFANLAEGKYGYDRWKKVGTNLVQIVESANFKKGAAYVLSGTNVPTTKMTAPTTGDWTITVPSNANNIQLELGDVPTPFEYRPFSYELQLCKRYYEKGNAVAVCDGTTAYIGASMSFASEKRAIPNVILKDSAGNVGKCTVDAANNVPAQSQKTTTMLQCYINNVVQGKNSFANFIWEAESEL